SIVAAQLRCALPPRMISWSTPRPPVSDTPVELVWHLPHNSLVVATGSYSSAIGLNHAFEVVWIMSPSTTWQVEQVMPTHSSSGTKSMVSAIRSSGSCGNLQVMQFGGGPGRAAGSQFWGEWQREQ